MGKYSINRFRPHAESVHGPFRFEDDTGVAAGHTMMLAQAVSPCFDLRREVEGFYVLPTKDGPDRRRDDQDGADDGE